MTNDELIEKADKTVAELVYPKYRLLKAYNYYNGIRDKDLFKYLEEMFGTSMPTTIEFTPLVRKHIDALIGEYLTMPIIPKVSCKDSDTITNIYRLKQLKIYTELTKYLKNHLLNFILSILQGKFTNDGQVESELKRIKDDIDNTFISDYEIASQDVLTYVMQSRDTDIMTVLRQLLLDVLITGYCFYRVEPTLEDNDIKIKALNPLNTFIDRNVESPYVKDSQRCVVRTWMSKAEIFSKYGKEMSKADRDILDEKWETIYENSMQYVRIMNNSCKEYATDGLLADIEVTPGYPSGRVEEFTLIPVYEIEWIETDKNFTMQRYEVIRIGEEIYICRGKNDKVIRSVSNPRHCTISVNGVYFLNRNAQPYSLMLACAHLQDRYDLLNFYRDNIIANSGTVGDWIDETLIPSHLGASMPERITKWISMKKQGVGLLNSAEEGRISQGTAPLNTIFNGYDDTVKAQAIQAIQLAIDSIEQTTSSITGVFRERLNGIEQRDAVTNIKQGVTNSFIVTKLYNHQMDLVVNEMLLDCLNLAKVVWKKGLKGTIVLGDKLQRVFTALPEYFTVSDHDVRIMTSDEVVKDIESIKAIIPEFVKSGGLPPDLIIEAITCKSLPELKYKIKKAMAQLKQENNLIQQLSLKLQEMQQELQQANQELQKANQKVEQLNQEKLQIQKAEVEYRNRVDWYKAETDRSYKEKMAAEAQKRTQAEIAQLYDDNPYNDKIRQIGS